LIEIFLIELHLEVRDTLIKCPFYPISHIVEETPPFVVKEVFPVCWLEYWRRTPCDVVGLCTGEVGLVVVYKVHFVAVHSSGNHKLYASRVKSAFYSLTVNRVIAVPVPEVILPHPLKLILRLTYLDLLD
jgi:hypothetical protein